MGVAPAGSDRANSGHHHLLIDTELPPLDKPIPNDFNHLHFGTGQTEAEVTLKPGPHTLQLLLGDKDHIPHNPPVMSPRIKVVVAEGAGATAAAPTTMRRRKRVQTHTAPPKRVVVEQRRSRPAYRSYYPYRSYYGYRLPALLTPPKANETIRPGGRPRRRPVSCQRPACAARRRWRSSHCAITPAMAALFFSIIIMWPLPSTPTSARRMSVLGTPAWVR